ncbi:hypothetical protein [Sporomusa sp.]|uniref:hypothetical protein n=1 Tax=Sporomusa sp. TaxID=2078658 RepID=UPI002C6D1F97|nr:hypothetical protein [Sporomusa sp.]HWR43033.1 hypothetical protein [Sporomusa sp.]
MEKVCPLCNAMQAIDKKCSYCGHQMIDGGSLNNYLGPYSPYVETGSLPFQSEGHCVHLLYCPVCDYDTRVALALVTI